MAVKQPEPFKAGRVSLSWSGDTSKRLNGAIKNRQMIIDSECLRLCSPLVPFRTGTLERSGTIGTVIGSGEIKYSTPYAREQYYNTATTRSYDHRRGAKWFERMKAANKKHIEILINKK